MRGLPRCGWSAEKAPPPAAAMSKPSSASDIPPALAAVIRPELQSLRGYVVQPSAGLVKLDVMENPFRLPPALRGALGERLGEVALNRYPAERTEVLRAALARHARMPEGCAMTLGNGSDELIAMLSLACARPGAVAMAPVPGFEIYELAARLHGLAFVGVPTTADFELDEPAMLAALREHRPALLYIAYPNNPTANLWDDATIDALIDAAPGLVVIDEAYQPFAARDSMARLQRHDKVLLMRTMSKFGLAGVRIGYLMGRSALIAQIDKLRPPFNISVLNAEAALFALEHEDEYARQAAIIRGERERVQRALHTLAGVRPFPSEANMILVRVPDADAVFEGMKRRGVLVKNRSRAHPLLAGCLRLTVGLPEENDRMIDALKASLP